MSAEPRCVRHDFEVFLARHQEGLARLAFLVTGDHAAADDVAADALIATWQNWDRVCASDHPIAYVRRTVVNLATDHIRRNVRERRLVRALIPGLSHHAGSPDSAAVLDVHSALRALPARRREVIVLRYAFDLSEEEVARTLRISVGTVKSQTSKAAAQLRGLLATIAPRPAADLTPSAASTGATPGRRRRSG